MFRRILLPVDFTDKNTAAVQVATELIEEDGHAILLHVIETIADAAFEDLEDFYRRLEDKARVNMQPLVEALDAQGVTNRQEILYGKRTREIVTFAEQHEIDLILLTSTPVDPQNPGAVWGSISNQVALLARCPVLLIK